MSPAAPPVDLPPGYPLGWEHHVVLADGGLAFLRPAVPADAPELEALFRRLSPEAQRLRTPGAPRKQTASEIAQAVHIDYDGQMAFAAFACDRLIGFGAWVRGKLPGDASAEVSFVVEDVHQGRGLGTLLLEQLAAYGGERGLHRLTARVQDENQRMLEVFRDAGFPQRTEASGSEVEVSLEIDPSAHARKVIEARHRKALMAWDRRRKARRRPPARPS